MDLGAPYAPEGKKGRSPFAVETMLLLHFMPQWFTLSDPAMEEALHEVPLFREFANLGWDSRLPDESTILRFRNLLEKHKLADQILGYGAPRWKHDRADRGSCGGSPLAQVLLPPPCPSSNISVGWVTRQSSSLTARNAGSGITLDCPRVCTPENSNTDEDTLEPSWQHHQTALNM